MLSPPRSALPKLDENPARCRGSSHDEAQGHPPTRTPIDGCGTEARNVMLNTLTGLRTSFDRSDRRGAEEAAIDYLTRPKTTHCMDTAGDAMPRGRGLQQTAGDVDRFDARIPLNGGEYRAHRLPDDARLTICAVRHDEKKIQAKKFHPRKMLAHQLAGAHAHAIMKLFGESCNRRDAVDEVRYANGR